MKRNKFLVGMILMLVLLALPTAALAVLELTIDIKPDKDTNVVSVNQPQLLPVAVYPDIYTIDRSSVTLQDVPASVVMDKGSYLLFKFNTQAVLATLGSVENGETYWLTLAGELTDGTPFEGYDFIVIVKRGR